MLTISVKSEISALARQLDAATTRQLPFAVANALTSTAFAARDAVRASMPSRFTIRRQWVIKGIAVKKATKADLTAVVFSRDAFMRRQETGEDKLPMQAGGKYIAVPLETVKRTKTAVVSARDLPRNLPNTLKNKGQLTARLEARDGRKFLARRDKRGKLTVLWALVPRAKMNKRLGLYDTTSKVIRAQFGKNLSSALEYALRTKK